MCLATTQWKNKRKVIFMYEIGRVVVKIAGRDANKKAVIVDVLDDNYVLLDGETRRRKCNIIHLEPLDETVKIKEKASAADVRKAFKDLGIEIKETKKKESKPRPRKARKKKEKAAPKKAKKAEKPKEEKKEKPAPKEAKK